MKKFLLTILFLFPAAFGVRADTNFDNNAYITTLSDDDYFTVSGDNRNINWQSLKAILPGGASGGGFTDGGSTVYTTTITDNVGIGTWSANYLLDVRGTSSFNDGSTTGTVSGPKSKISFDTLSNGAIRMCSTGNTNNECIDSDLETTANKWAQSSSTGVTLRTWTGAEEIAQTYLGGVQKGSLTAWDITADTLFLLKSEENAANTTVVDAQGLASCVASANTSTLTTTGKINNAFTYTAASSNKLTCGSYATTTGDFTTGAWVKTSSTGTARAIMGTRSTTGTNVGFDLRMTSANIANLLVDTGASVQNVGSTTTLTDGNWHLVVGRRSGSTISISVDNSWQGTPTGSISGDVGTGSDPLLIGKTPLTTTYWNGQIDNPFFVQRALTDNEVSQLYASASGTDSLSGVSGSGSPDIGLVVGTTTSIASTHSLASRKDALIEGKLELDGDAYFDGQLLTGSGAGRIGYNLTAYAAGTAYSLTATPALLDFGTTDPTVTIDKAGTYLILSRAYLKYNAATFVANQTATLKLRRTNNTAADLTGATTTATLRIITTLTDTIGIMPIPPVIYTTANTSDIIQIFGSVSATPAAGSVDATEADIEVIRLY